MRKTLENLCKSIILSAFYISIILSLFVSSLFAVIAEEEPLYLLLNIGSSPFIGFLILNLIDVSCYVDEITDKIDHKHEEKQK